MPAKLSQTFLRHFENCPRSAYLYARFKGGSSTHPLERGSLFHLFAEEALKTMIREDENSMSPEQGRELMEHLITTAEFVVPFAEQDDLLGMAWNWSEVTWIDPATVLAVETMAELAIAGWIVRGKVDFAATTGTVVEVVDWKTARFPKQQRQLRTFQTAFYGATIGYGSLDGAPVLDHLNHFMLSERYPRSVWTEDGQPVLAHRDFEIERERLLKFRHYLEGLVQRAETAFETWNFRAVEGDHCKECPARALCPIPDYLRRGGESTTEGFSFLVEPPEIETPEQAAEVASRRFFMQQQVRKDGKALRDWADEQGPIRFGKDLVLEVVPTEKTELVTDRVEFAEAIEAAVTWGKPFDIAEHYQLRHGFSLSKRALTEDELAAEAAEDPDEKEDSQMETDPTAGAPPASDPEPAQEPSEPAQGDSAPEPESEAPAEETPAQESAEGPGLSEVPPPADDDAAA